MPLHERDRRWGLVRATMAQRGLAALIAGCSGQMVQRGHVRYLTDWRESMYPGSSYLIFPLQGEPILLGPTGIEEYWMPKLSWVGDVRMTASPAADIACILDNLGLQQSTLGVALETIPASVYTELRRRLPQASLEPATDIVEAARMVKSPREIKLVEQAAALADKGYETFRQAARPGRTELDVWAEVDAELKRGGAEESFFFVTAGKGPVIPYAPTRKVIEVGDIVILNEEVAGPGGYWVQLVRTASVGNPRPEIEAAHQVCLRALERGAQETQAGRTGSQVAKIVLEVIQEAGYQLGLHIGHAMGLDMVERPRLRLDDDTVIQLGMVVDVHPHVVIPGQVGSCWLAEPYLVTEGGPRRMCRASLEFQVL